MATATPPHATPVHGRPSRATGPDEEPSGAAGRLRRFLRRICAAVAEAHTASVPF
jgi:hypothetical protein